MMEAQLPKCVTDRQLYQPMSREQKLRLCENDQDKVHQLHQTWKEKPIYRLPSYQAQQ